MEISDKKGSTKKIIVLAVLVIISRLSDIISTYLYIPDLRGETNILVKFLGAGWVSIIIIQSLLVGVSVYLLYYYLFKFKPNYPTEKGLTLNQFASYLYFNDTSYFGKLFYKTPKNKNVFFASIGYVVSMTLITVGFMVGTSTTLLLLSDTYKQLYKNGIPTLLFVLTGVSALWFYYRFFSIEYKKYKQYINFNQLLRF
ncbi:MAG: hypothetical protein PHP52_02895 [Bacteroidales bacterium]|nr:hypothetical protein [Bacteroidales bacterium]MDD4216081.1 hypothetical protein [Bacteroidales bacterium]MDY0141201.1 hypothetical protein [Bacteroidales bacterium]